MLPPEAGERSIYTLDGTLQGLDAIVPVPQPILRCQNALSVPEMADSRKCHRDAKAVRCGDHFGVAHRAARLDNRRRACICNGFHTVWKGEKNASEAATVPGSGRAAFMAPKRGRIHAAHLAGADTYRLAEALLLAGIDNCVRLHMLADLPGKEQSSGLVRSRLSRCRIG